MRVCVADNGIGMENVRCDTLYSWVEFQIQPTRQSRAYGMGLPNASLSHARRVDRH